MRAAVLGRPIAHSLSPALHNAAYAALGLDWTYEAIDCGVGELAGLLETHADWAGFSCTMPLKHAALELASEVTPAARAVRAANTLLPADGGWRADNTDVDGVLGALAGVDLAGRDVVVLGAGGTAQAVVVALARAGVERFDVLVRDPARTSSLRETAEYAGVRLEVRTLAPDERALDAGLVVSTLPAGAADVMAAHPWRPDQALLDVVYAPWPTRLAEMATRGGATVVGGAEMLLHQAGRQVELMTGEPAPLDAMRAALPLR